MKELIHTAIILSMIFSVDASYAQRNNRKKTVTTRKAPPKKAATVADVLSRYKDNDRGGSVQISKFTKIIPDSTAPKQVVVRNTFNIKPPSSTKFFIRGNEKEAQLEKLLDQQIQELYSLSQKFRKSAERGEIWLRLGELYVEKAKLVQYRIQSDFDKKVAAWESKGRKGNPPKIQMDAPQVYNKKAIELYGWYINDFLTIKKLVQAYFFMW